jgi:hypothetical protein
MDVQERDRATEVAVATEVERPRGGCAGRGEAVLQDAGEDVDRFAAVGGARSVDAREVDAELGAQMVDECVDERDVGVRQAQVELGVVLETVSLAAGLA